MNINDALYDGQAVRAEIDRLIAEGLTFDEAIARLVDQIIATTVCESRQGVVHGVLERLI